METNIFDADKFYYEIVEIVSGRVKEDFVAEGMQKQVFDQFKQDWMIRLNQILAENKKKGQIVEEPRPTFRSLHPQASYAREDDSLRSKIASGKTTNEIVRIYKEMNEKKKPAVIQPDEKEEKDDSSSEDSALALFNKPKEKEEEKPDSDEELSEMTESFVDEEKDTKDFMIAQYDKVHRVKGKYKCAFKDVILSINGKEYIFSKINAELERDW